MRRFFTVISPITLVLTLISLTIGLYVRPSTADVGDEILVNDDYSATYQGYADVAVGPAGQFVVVWSDQRNVHRDIYSQVFDRDGARATSNRLLVDELGGNEQFDPRVSTDASGTARVVWMDYRASGYPLNPDVYLQSVAASGEPIGANTKVNTDFGTAAQGNPDVAVKPDGTFWVVWEDYRNNRWDIYGQKYTAAGAADGANFRVTDIGETAAQHRPAIAFDGTGNGLVVWYDNRSGDDDIFGQFFGQNGAPRGANVRISASTAASQQRQPDASGIALGGFVVAWTDYRSGPYPNNPDIYLQRFDGAGIASGSNVRVNTDIGSYSQQRPRIAAASDGEHVVLWRDNRNGNEDVCARRFAPDGTARDDDYQVVEGGVGFTQSDPVAAISDTRVVSVWTDDRDGSFDIYATIDVYSTASIAVEPSVLNYTSRADQTAPITQNTNIANSATGTLEWVAADNRPWIDITPHEGTAPSTMTVTVAPGGMGLGTHTGFVAIKDRWNSESAETLLVVLNVTPAGPIIAVSPEALTFNGGFPDAPPAPAVLHVSNEGVDELAWSIEWYSDWIVPDLTAGTSLDSTLVQIDITLLGPGIFYDTISVIDPAAANSPVKVPVTLNLTDNVPMIAIEPDSLTFVGQEGEMLPADSLLVTNAGNGVLTVTIDSLPPWLAVFPADALAPQWIAVTVDSDSLSAGVLIDTIWFSSLTASNSPVAVAVTVMLDERPPQLSTTTNLVEHQLWRGNSPLSPDSLAIQNSGGGTFDWIAATDDDWLSIKPTSGLPDDTLAVTLLTDTLPVGEHVGTVSIVDTTGKAGSTEIIESVTVVEPDTLHIGSATVSAGQKAFIPITLFNVDSIIEIEIGFRHEPGTAWFDSITASGLRLSEWTFVHLSVDSADGIARLFARADSGSALAPGDGPIAALWMGTELSSTYMQVSIDTASADLMTPEIHTSRGQSFMPVVIAGELSIEQSTGILDEDPDPNTETTLLSFSLGQNYPNPFNSATVIPVTIEQSGTYELTIYDILGRRVRELWRGHLAQGTHALAWDGFDKVGSEVSSGVYFTRIVGEAHTATRKMILLR